MVRNDLSKEIIYKTVKKTYEINKNISITRLFKLVCEKLNCSLTFVKNKFGSFDIILKELNINIPKGFIDPEVNRRMSDCVKNSEKFQKAMKSEKNSEKIREGMKNSDKWQKIVHSKEHSNNIREGQKNSEKFQRIMHSIEHSRKTSGGMKNSEKWQNYINSEDRRKNISLGLKNSKKFKDSIKKLSLKNRKNVSLDVIGQNLLNKVKYEGSFSLTDFMADNHRDFSSTVVKRVLKENNITIDDFAKSKGVEFIDRRKINRGHIGFNEKQILDDFEEKIGYKIIRQFPVGKYHTDGYIREINKPLEVDELHHFDKNGNQIIEDIIRENNIRRIIGCGDFIRIKDTGSNNIINNKQKGLEDF